MDKHDEVLKELGLEEGGQYERVYYVSDVHNDYNRQNILQELEADPEGILVVAGDVNPKGRMVRDLEAIAPRWGHIVAVPGNHDWWGLAVHETDKFKTEVDNLHILLNDWTVINGITFVGGTGWFHSKQPVDWAYWAQFSDSKRVRGSSWTKFTLQAVAAEHAKFLNIVEEMRHVQGPKVLVSHHLLSEKGVAPHFKSDPYNPFYVTDSEHVVSGYDHHVHGHTHHVQTYTVGNTKVHSNPWGYGSEVHDRQLRFFEVKKW